MAVRNLLVNLGLIVGNAAAKIDPSGIASQLLARYSKARDKEQLEGELEGMLQLGFGRFREELAEAMGELRLSLAERDRGRVEAYLMHCQASAKQASRVLGDPLATTVPRTVHLDDPAQLAAFLPQFQPRFAVGDTVPGLPSWVLVEPLGVGGFGEVWKAKNPYSGVAAFKFFLDPEARRRFTLTEASTLAEIHKSAPPSGVVKLLAAEPEQEPPWIQLEYAEGGDLSRLPQAWKSLPDADRVKRVQAVVRNLAATVGHFHKIGVVHRDLKPSNVLLRKTANNKYQPVVADFGISELVPAHEMVSTLTNSTSARIRAYTALYASPQQKRFQAADRRDDVYALGVLWYQLLRNDLTLERPSGDGWKNSLTKLGVDEATILLLNRCWDDEADARPADGNELALLLAARGTPAESAKGEGFEAFAWSEEETPKERASESEREKSRVRGNQPQTARGGYSKYILLAMCLIAVVVGVILFGFGGQRPDVAENQAGSKTPAGPSSPTKKSIQTPQTPIPKPFAKWTFDKDASDSQGKLPGTLYNGAEVRNGRLKLGGPKGGYMETANLPQDISDKTLEMWVAFENPGETSDITVFQILASDGTWDGLVFSPNGTRKWYIGSSFSHRSRASEGRVEAAAANELIHVAVTYKLDNNISVYRNGMLYDSFTPTWAGNGSRLQTYEARRAVVRFEFEKPTAFEWWIEEARLYDKALSDEEIKSSDREFRVKFPSSSR